MKIHFFFHCTSELLFNQLRTSQCGRGYKTFTLCLTEVELMFGALNETISSLSRLNASMRGAIANFGSLELQDSNAVLVI